MNDFATGMIGTADSGTPEEQSIVIVSGNALNDIPENPYVLTMNIVQAREGAEPYMIHYRDGLYIETPTITHRRKAAITLSGDQISFEFQQTLTRALTGICSF